MYTIQKPDTIYFFMKRSQTNFFYGIAAALFVGFLLSIFICCEPGTDGIESDDEEEEEYSIKYKNLRQKYLVLVEKAKELKQINDEMAGQVNHSYT